MKKTTIFYVAVLLASSALQAQAEQVPAVRLPNGQLTCPSGFRGPIQPAPGGAWVCVR
jgi:hypothetical protein